MRNYILIFFISIFSLSSLFAQEVEERPSPPRLVNDFTNTLNGSETQQLETKLVAYNDSTSTQIAVVIVPTLKGYAIAEYAQQLGEKWGVGQKGQDNGIIVLIAIGEREAFIATGYGMEAIIPDVTAKHIVDDYMVPNFKNGKFYEGINVATDIIFAVAAGQYHAEPVKKKGGSPVLWILGIIIIMIILSNIFGKRGGGTSFSSGGRRYYGGSPWGGSFGGGGGGGFGGFGGGGFGGGGAGGRW